MYRTADLSWNYEDGELRVYDCETFLFSASITEQMASDTLIRATLLDVYCTGRRSGEAYGRSKLKGEFRALINQ